MWASLVMLNLRMVNIMPILRNVTKVIGYMDGTGVVAVIR